MAASALMRPDIFCIVYHMKTSQLTEHGTKFSEKKSIHPKCKEAHTVQFWKIVSCCLIQFFSSQFFFHNIIWSILIKNTYRILLCFISPCYDFIWPSVFTDASCYWVKSIWSLSPRLSSWLLGIACLNQVVLGLGDSMPWSKINPFANSTEHAQNHYCQP